MFIIGCNYQLLNPNRSSLNSGNESVNNNSGNNDGNSDNELGNNNGSDEEDSEPVIKTMYFKFKVSGKSSKKAFNKSNIFPRELSIKKL